MVTVLKLAMIMNDSNLMLLDVKKAYRTVFASCKQTNRNTRDRPNRIAEHVDKRVTNLQITGKTPRIKRNGQQTGKEKIHQRRHTQKQQKVAYIVAIVTIQDTQKTDVSRRKGKYLTQRK
jgi:hypothetical protein